MSSWPWRQSSRCGTWILLLALAGCGGDGSSGPPIPAEIVLGSTTFTLAAAGQSEQISVTVREADGDVIPNATVTWESSAPAVAAVSDASVLTAQGPGTATVTATAGEATATAEVSVVADASLEIVEGDAQNGEPGQTLSTAPAVRVVDESDNPVPGVRILFEVTGGGGSVTGQTQTTGTTGVARVGSWQLGTSGGVHSLRASVEGAELDGEPVQFQATASAFDITLRYLSTLTAAQTQAFELARDRWQGLIVGDLADVSNDLPADACGDNPATNGPFDDVTIFITIEPIDGPQGVLGQAGPCFIRTTDQLTVVGRMQFDTDDMELIEQEGLLQEVVLHEMGHVLGFGTLWPNAQHDLLRDPSDPNPDPPLIDTHFIGQQAINAFNAAGGNGYSGAKVPVMNEGGAGTVNSHWRDAVFGNEVMTGFINTGVNPMSAISVRAMQDLGYTVSIAGADSYTIDPSLRMSGPRRGIQLGNDVIRDPIRVINLDGSLMRVIHP
jgi:hypothetical protein